MEKRDRQAVWDIGMQREVGKIQKRTYQRDKDREKEKRKTERGRES